MRFGICGLGRMGKSLGLHAVEKGHDVVGFDPAGSEELQAAGGTVVESIAALADALEPPRVALVYVPHGEPTEQVVRELAGAFDAGDVVAAVFHNWNHGSVIRSWLVELMEKALRSKHDMAGVDPFVEDTGEQRWGIEFAVDKEIPIPLLAQAVWGFYESRDPDRPWAKTVALLRHEYGKHPLRGRAGSDS